MKIAKITVFNSILVLSAIGIMIFLLAGKFDYVVLMLRSIQLSYVVIIVALAILYHILVGISLTRLARVTNPSYTYFKGIHNAFIAAFFHGITPGSSGGQVAQAFVFNKQGVDSASAASILWIEFVLHQASLVIIGFVFLFTKIGILRMFNSNLQFLVVIGFVVNLVVLVFLYLIVQSPRFNQWFLIKGLVLLKKIKLVKNIESNQKKIITFVEQFEKAQKLFIKNLDAVAKVTLVMIVKLFVLYFIPYLIIHSFGVTVTNFSFIDIMALSAFLGMLKVFAPLPGGLLGTEILFILLFSLFTSQIVATSTMIVWRFVSFYMIMVIGLLFYIWYKFKLR